LKKLSKASAEGHSSTMTTSPSARLWIFGTVALVTLLVARGLLLEPGMSWSEYLAILDADGGRERFPDGVASTFLVAEVDGDLVGRSSIRHELNDFLAREGGHIGFGVVPEFRRRGYATAILEQSLVVARALGISDVLVTCDDDNVGSATVIERCGGILDSIILPESGETPVRRYWIR
jgi:predicted acetyltransferase